MDVTDRIGYRLNRYNVYGIYYALAVVVHQMRHQSTLFVRMKNF